MRPRYQLDVHHREYGDGCGVQMARPKDTSQLEISDFGMRISDFALVNDLDWTEVSVRLIKTKYEIRIPKSKIVTR